VLKRVCSKSPDHFDTLDANAVQPSGTDTKRIKAPKAKLRPAAVVPAAPVGLSLSPFGGVDKRFLTDKQVGARYGVSRAAVWRWLAAYPDFPKPIAITPGTTRWRLSEIMAYEAAAPDPRTLFRK